MAPVSRITQQILDRSDIPYIRTDRSTTDIFLSISDDVSKITAEDTEKLALIHSLAAKRFDFAAVDSLFG